MNAGLKIVIVEPYTRTGGHFAWFAERTCTALTKLHHEVTLVTYGGLPLSDDHGELRYTLIDAAPAHGNKFVDHPRERWISVSSLGLFLRKAKQEFATFRAAARLPASGKTVLHFYDANPVFLLIACRFVLQRGRKRHSFATLLTIHEVGYLSGEGNPLRRIYKRFVATCLGRLIKYRLDGIIVFDAAIQEKLVSRYTLAEKAMCQIRLLPHGMDEPLPIGDKSAHRRKLGVDLNETVFLALGVIRKDKRIDLAVEAIKGVPNARLVIAGKPGDLGQSEIDAMIREHSAESCVTTDIGYIDEERLHSWFFAADALVLPYSKSFNGSSGVLTHACSHGRCVIAADVGQVGEAVRSHAIGFVVESDNAIALREAMLRFMRLDSSQRAEIEQRALQTARRYSWNAVSTQVAGYYQELLGNRDLVQSELRLNEFPNNI